GVILLAFVLTWFFRVPPLRKVSALQEQANAAKDGQDRLTADAQEAAANTGSLVTPHTGSMDVVPTSPDVTVPRQDQPGGTASPAGPVASDGWSAPASPAAADTRAPLPDATTHGAHSAAAPVDEPPTTTGTIRTRPAHAAPADGTDASAPDATTPAPQADPAEASRASRPDQGDHPHGRHSAE
ncbi:MAG: hypothetical protein V4737_17065, partial [Curtobacterium sp.]